MGDVLPFIVSGIATGSMYGLLASGLVLTHKTSGILNFSHGAIATVAAYLFYVLHYQHHVPWLAAICICVIGGGLVMGLLLEPFMRRLAGSPTALQIVGPIGIILLVQAAGNISFGTDTVLVPQFLPDGTKTFSVGGVDVLYPQLIVTVFGVVAVICLYLFLRWTRVGMSMRAVAEAPVLLAMRGENPAAVRRWSWIVGSVFASASGVLILPFLGLNGTALTMLVVQAFGAAAFGGFVNLPMAYVGGLVLGIASSVAQQYVLSVSWLAGVPDSLPFVILFLMLLVIPKRYIVRRRDQDRSLRPSWHAPAPAQLGAGVVIFIVLAVIPQIVGGHLQFFTIGLTQAIVILGLGLLVRTSGQISLCQAAFAAIGAVAFCHFASDSVPWLAAVLCGALVAVPVGIIVAVPAIRLSGVYLALATLGFGILVDQLFYGTQFMFTPLANGLSAPRPSIAQSDQGYYYIVVAFFVVAAVLVVIVERSRLGRLLRAISDAPVAVGTLGLSTQLTRTVVFSISAFLAGLGGILYVCTIHFAVSTDSNFVSFNSLVLLAILALAPFGAPWYALIAGIAAVIPGYISGTHTADWLNVIFGAAAVMLALTGGQPVAPAWFRSAIDRLRLPARRERQAVASAPVASAATEVPDGGAGLRVTDLGVRFGGVPAVDHLSLGAPLGRITGLIGPNGAGKTTTFNACSGLVSAGTGTITLHDRPIGKASPAKRARLGLGRTFQHMDLADTLTVSENVQIGREAALAGSSLPRQLLESRGEKRTTASRVGDSLELCGIQELSDRVVGSLSTGQRRLVELARCLAGAFDLLLLDEPSSGLDPNETRDFGEVVRRVVRERGCGVLIVEHDMSLVTDICDHLYVMDSGRLIFEGTPMAAMSNSEVQRAYLGVSAGAEETAHDQTEPNHA